MSASLVSSSRLPGFHRQNLAERQDTVRDWAVQAGCQLSDQQWRDLLGPPAGLDLATAEQMAENTIGRYALPLGIATNFCVNGRDRLIPMVIEEPSVIAGASNAARLMRISGGITASSDPPLMIGQIQLLEIADMASAIEALNGAQESILSEADASLGSLVERGGGARTLQFRPLQHPELGAMLITHLLLDCRDAMGANAINTALEHIAPILAKISGGRAVLRILSNLSDQRLVRARAQIPASALPQPMENEPPVVQRIVEAAALAEIDPYRAATHNKGILNGIDAVALATGNDWRAVEAGAHAYAARAGSYRSLSRWWLDEVGNLHGSLELPLALGAVGGATRAHPGARAALALLAVESAGELAEIAAAVGLAQNFAALRALAGEGIQHGHMRLHARQIALAAGATSDTAAQVAESLISEGNIRLSRAREMVKQTRTTGSPNERI